MFSSGPYPFSMSTSHFKMMAKSSLTFTPNLPTNTNTYYTFVMSSHTYLCTKRAIFFSVAFQSWFRPVFVQPTKLSHSAPMKLSITFTNVAITAISFKVQRVNNIIRTEALMPHDTSTLDKTGRVPFVITYNTALCSISSIIRKHVHFHIFISSPRCYNLFKAAPIE